MTVSNQFLWLYTSDAIHGGDRVDELVMRMRVPDTIVRCRHDSRPPSRESWDRVRFETVFVNFDR
jgi:hypothetical protein